MRQILFTASGHPRRGSWLIRGCQLGEAVGGKAVLEASDVEIAQADLVVVVKSASSQLLGRIRRRGVPWVLDLLDCWPQPQGNAWTSVQARQWLRAHVGKMAPTGLVCATEAMSRDLVDCGPRITLYHHARPGQAVNPIRDEIQTIGYEGSERYLDHWRKPLEEECRARGWRFVVNPPQLADLDIVVALRGGEWDGWATRRWKSNVKLANAQGSGTPIICQPDAGYAETSEGGAWLVIRPDEIAGAFSKLSDVNERRFIAKALRAKAPTLNVIAGQYRSWLDTL